jgi:K+/H+ antiporter YhaU regulatory subunit KhtT
MGIRRTLTKQALEVSRKAMESLVADEERARTLAAALGSMQRGKQALDRSQEELMHTLHFATRSDFKAVGKALSGLKRRLRELDEKLGRLGGE